MNNHKPTSELKSLAKGQLLGKYSVLIGAMVLQTCIIMMFQLIVSTFFSSNGLMDTILYYLVSFLLSLVSGIFTAGLCLMFLKVACRYQSSFQDIFWGFQHTPDKIILLQVPLTLLQMVCMIPAYVMQFQFQTAEYLNMRLYVYSLLLSGAGTLLYVILQLAFSQVFFLLHDFPNYSVRELYKMSIQIMKGQKLRLLYLELSFLPLFMLSILSCGIGLLWLQPYINVTEANYYLDLMANRNRNQ